ncbi:S24 family peptidase [Neptuniibacter sp.]|uniref:LexA family protein n=1 Tax=Neptuniibacter sp. TaxID=1962643 RepID=UPI00263695AB|nr:S24 family peptidase [Neptuniibacter sp.]MCP4595775.1 hypothetical protein [Neptuniibacter sp.]
MKFIASPENRADLNEITNCQHFTVYMFTASGPAMERAGIFNGDLLVVDRALEPQNNDVVVAAVDGEFVVRRLQLNPDLLLPDCDNNHYPPIVPETTQYGHDVTYLGIFGVVTNSVHRFRND